jgi:CspA family cold shock protein
MPTGIVRFFNAHKQYGFIDPADGSPQVFVHATEVAKAGISHLDRGTPVEYDLGEQKSEYPRAINLKLTQG